MSQDKSAPANDTGPMIAQGTDEEPLATNQRSLAGRIGLAVTIMAIAYTMFHIYVMNISPLEPWTYRMVHVTGGLFIGFLTYSALTLNPDAPIAARGRSPIEWGLIAIGAAGVLYGAAMVAYAWAGRWFGFAPMPDAFVFSTYGLPLLIGTIAAVAAAWLFSDRDRERVHPADWLLGIAALAMFGYIIFNVGALRLRAGTGMAQTADFYAALVGVILILELTRRVAGLALVIIAGVFIAYSFVGPWLPGFLTHRGYTAERFFTYIFTDQGILGDPIAVSSTYIILFIVFAAFLQASRVGDYFVNFAFAAAGNLRGGPA
ncbi:MAG: TRAP transporter large permease subunit, partial [Alphaproteobacteria bacterium]